ncbi:MAG: DUF444 family protein [Thermaerobacter sp.]|nr:DUF444 family protein [Thermaerobacter sp.]
MDNVGRVFHTPWDLNRKGSLDQARHAEKLKDAILRKLPEVVQELPLEGGPARVKIPLKVLDLPKFRPKPPEEPDDGIGQKPGKPGDIVARVPRGGAPGQGDGGPGDRPGEHEVEVEVDRETLIQMVLDDLKLPRLTGVSPPELTEPTDAWNSRRDHGPLSALDRRHTLKAAIMRSQIARQSLNFHPDDLKYRATREVEEPVTRATVYFLRDISGSMGDERKFLSKATAFWVTAWLRRQYPTVRLEWWVHDTEPQRLESESLFFQLGEGGGTRVAPAYYAIAEHMRLHYPPQTNNNYFFHFTDGDVFGGDPVGDAARELLPLVRWFGLVELAGLTRGALGRQLQDLSSPPFRAVRLNRREDVLAVVRALLETAGPKAEGAS